MNSSNEFKPAKVGAISEGTLRTEDLLSCFLSELESQILRNGGFLSLPENFPMRDRLANLVGEAQDAWSEDGETLKDEYEASEILNELQDALGEFAPAYSSFGTHPGDGACFGFWADVDQAKEDCAFVSCKDQAAARRLGMECDPEDASYPAPDFRGEWLHVSDHGNVTLYVRGEDGKDVEIWGVV
jgi:hypothetical protein